MQTPDKCTTCLCIPIVSPVGFIFLSFSILKVKRASYFTGSKDYRVSVLKETVQMYDLLVCTCGNPLGFIFEFPILK